MDLRIRSLQLLDPHAVPLPHGTEVTTCVDRLVGDRVVPQGAVGRVLSGTDDLLDVLVVGVGTIRYSRAELVPAKAGQIRYAVRRESAWTTLRPCVVMETVVGSRAWGLADLDSDTDVRGVFALPFPWTAGLVQPPSDLVSADGSTTFWEIGKAIRQALRADPNTLEMLFVPDAHATDDIGQWLLDEREAFVSSRIYGSFGRYALSQLKKLQQTARLAEHRVKVLLWLREDPFATLEQISARLAQIDPRAAVTGADAQHQAKQYVKQLYRSMHDQGLLEAADFTSLAQFAMDRQADFELPRELRPKNAYNLLRLILTASQWLKTGIPNFRMEGPERQRLRAIKRGEVPLADILEEAESLSADLEPLRAATKLPAQPNVQRADALLRRIGEECARRWISKATGPFGAQSPAVPDVEWE